VDICYNELVSLDAEHHVIVADTAGYGVKLERAMPREPATSAPAVARDSGSRLSLKLV
jgi:hypothetical protein